MDVIYGLLPGMILLGLVAVGVFFWAARSGQFEDMEGEANRILLDEDLDDVRRPRHGKNDQKAASKSDPQPPADPS